jgi:hypothetical protein
MAQNANMSIKYNDNLVQISDWLTKIIVGVGLTQLTKIPAKISVLGFYLKDSVGIGGLWERNAALAIVFYFLILGFLALYFWARTDYTEIVKDVDDDLQKKLEEAVKEKEAAVLQKEETKDSVITGLQKNEEQLLVTLVADGSITESDKALITALPPITVLDDPQKGRFGKLAEKNGYKLTGTVTDSTWPGYWDVLLEVSRTDSTELADVLFLIHNTFNPAIKKITPENFVNGKATLSLSPVYGSFTVGVITDGGKTMLELDLAGLPGVSEKFKNS